MEMLCPYEYWDNELGIQARFLFQGRDAHPDSLELVGERALQRMVHRDLIKQLRMGVGRLPLLLEFDTLPGLWQSLSRRVFGEPDETIRAGEEAFIRDWLSGRHIGGIPEREQLHEQAQAEDTSTPEEWHPLTGIITISPEAQQWYEQFEYDLNGVQTHLSEKLRREYTANASVLEAATGLWNAGKRRDALSIVENSRAMLNHTLPHSPDRIEDRIRQYRTLGFESLISGKLGNTNTLKITAEASAQIIALKRSRTPVYTDMQLFDRYNEIARSKGWDELKSIRSLKQFLEQPHIEPLWWDAVHGELKSAQRYSRRHRTKLPQVRDALWYGDGTKLNLYYRDESGRMRTTMVYEVMDAYSEVLLGYFISDTEDHEAQYHAYRMAIQTAGHKPYEIVHDNQGGHKKADSAGLFSKICRIHRTTAPYNAESKTIESAFGRFQSAFLHRDWRFTGQNITSKKASSRPNLEFIEANKDKLYTLNELKSVYAGMRKQWNEAAHPATGIPRIEMYRNSCNTATQEVTPADMVEMFWLQTKEPGTFTSQGIEITVKGKKYRYEVFSSPGTPDREWRRLHTFDKFYVKYDPYDMTGVRLYRRDTAGELRFERTAEPYMEIHRAIQEQEEGEAEFIRREQGANLSDRVERQIAARAIEAEHGVAPEQHGLSTPKLKGTTAKVREELERQCARRTKRYGGDPEEYQAGRAAKAVSLMTYDELEEDETATYNKRANKL